MTDIVHELANYEPQELFEVLIGVIMEAGSLEVELQQEASSMLGKAADCAAANGAKENERLLRLAELAIGGGMGAAPSTGTLRTLLSLHQIAKSAIEEAPAVVDAAAIDVPQAASSSEVVNGEAAREAGSDDGPREEGEQLEASESALEGRKRGRRQGQPATKRARRTKLH